MRSWRAGIPLGLFPTGTMPFESRECSLQPGDSMVIYSDGIPESGREDREQLGEERLMRVARESCGKSAPDVFQSIYEDVLAFIGDAPRSDDITVTALKVL